MNIDRIFGETFLQQILEFVNNWCEINDVFTQQNIRDWLVANADKYGYVKEGE